MLYRVVYWSLWTALSLGFFWVLIKAAESKAENNTSMWILVPFVLVYLFFPKEWLAEKISRQPRVDPWGRRGDASEG